MRKALTAAVSFLFCASLLSGQSLAELSKKEKERREALKGKKALVITNADLDKTGRKAGIETPLPQTPAAPAGTIADAAVQAESQPVSEPPEGEPAEPAPSPEAPPVAAPGAADAIPANLAAKHAQAKEYADLLELKMGALWQQFYGLDDMTPREAIQQEIALTFDKLEKAREAEKQAKKDLDDYLARQGRESAPPLWIR